MDINLDHLMKVAVTGVDVIDNSVIAKLVSSAATADWDTFVNTTDSLQAIRDTPPLGTAMRGTDSAAVQTACDASLVAIHLDHLLAVDTPTLPGVAGSILQDLLEDDGGTWRFIANALEQAPTGADTDHEVLKTGTVAASPTPTATSLSSTALSEATTDFRVNKIVQMTSGAASGLTARITAFDAGNDAITFDPAMVVTPAVGDTFDILRKHVEAAGLTASEKAKLVTAARMTANKADHDVASGVNRYYDDAGTTVLVIRTPTETDGVVTVTPS